MGKKGKWLSTVKKVFSPASSKNTKLSVSRSKNGSFAGGSSEAADAPSDIKCVDAGSYGEQTKHVHPAPTAAPSDQQAAASAQVTNLSTPSPSKEEMAAVAIQTAFRGYMSRRALRALKGLVRLRSLVQGSAVMRQVMNTVKHMHLLTHVRSQIQSRRTRMFEENQALQRQLILQKQAEELQMLQVEEEWDDSLKSKEQIETKLMSRREAALRRERALAYAFTHQKTLRSSSKIFNPLFIPPGIPTWGWSCLERWKSSEQWGSPKTSAGKEPLFCSRINSKNTRQSLNLGEIGRALARYQLNSDKSFPVRSSPSQHITPQTASSLKNIKTVGERRSVGGPEDDSSSILSFQRVKHRRHSIAGCLSVKDVESLASSSLTPRYMVPTKSAMAKSRP
uniref:DUF4005 domain-containing protein n=1 Tax=Kalanchoe fedtschenkoi TaxID=63787 RepID=A0A7N1A8V1_KALFE